MTVVVGWSSGGQLGGRASFRVFGVVSLGASRDRVYGQILRDALVHVGPRIVDPAKRHAFARVAHFALRSLRPDETVIADVLAATTAATDHAGVLRSLLCGVWSVAEDDPRLLAWFTKVADRALERGHLAAFCTVTELVVHLPAFEGHASDAWLAGIRAAREDDRARALVFWLAWYWQQRFFPPGGAPIPVWLLELREDERVLAAAAIVEGERVALCCPACGKPFSP